MSTAAVMLDTSSVSAAQSNGTIGVGDGKVLVASGLESPRGLEFGPDGYLYIAEAGAGGSNSVANCNQFPPLNAATTYTGGKTARISRVGGDGKLVTVASGLPSALDNRGSLQGVADIAFLGGNLYALLAGGGCSHGNPDVPNGIVEVNVKTGKWKLVADLSQFLAAHPAAYPDSDDFEPDGLFYSVVSSRDGLFAVDANHGQVFRIGERGRISEFVDISASEGHVVPAALAQRDGFLYVGILNVFPISPQWARVLTLAKDGYEWNPAPGFEKGRHEAHIVDSKAGFTTVVAVDFGPDGLLYALELSDAPGGPTPGTGDVVRVTRSGDIEKVVTGLTLPTGMTFGPNGALYVSNMGATPAGQILEFHITPAW
jgi:hypothetical protein